MADSARSIPLRAADEIVPTYAFPENAVRALGKIVTYAGWRAQPPSLHWDFDDVQLDQARAISQRAAADGGGWLTAEQSSRLLQAFGLPVVPLAVAHSAEEAAEHAARLGFPVAAKIASPIIQHKTDVGGVRLNLATADAVRQAFADLLRGAQQVAPDGPIDGVIVQPMVGGGIETIVGVVHDPVFGPLVGFGIGGVDVEVLGDIRFRIAPLTDRDADELLREIRGFRLLQGHRGRPPADLEALRDVLLRVSRLAEALPEVVELDLNPVLALSPGNGCRVVDARIRISGTVP
jgi:acyl-CoA synthetase (NDP forming)